jgi:hypothetical protein
VEFLRGRPIRQLIYQQSRVLNIKATNPNIIGLLSLLLVSCLATSCVSVNPAAHEELCKQITDRYTTQSNLINAISRLSMPPCEKPDFWRSIISDSSYKSFTRRQAVIHLLKRHSKEGGTILDFAQLLGKNNWLRTGDIRLIDTLGGAIPVEYNLEDTFILLLILPEPKHASAVYLRIQGKIKVEDFRTFLLENKLNENLSKKTDTGDGFCW